MPLCGGINQLTTLLSILPFLSTPQGQILQPEDGEKFAQKREQGNHTISPKKDSTVGLSGIQDNLPSNMAPFPFPGIWPFSPEAGQRPSCEGCTPHTGRKGAFLSPKWRVTDTQALLRFPQFTVLNSYPLTYHTSPRLPRFFIKPIIKHRDLTLSLGLHFLIKDLCHIKLV